MEDSLHCNFKNKFILKEKVITTEQLFAINSDYYHDIRSKVCLTNDDPVSLTSLSLL